MPGYAGRLGSAFYPIQEFRCRTRMGQPVEGDVKENIGIQENHERYLSARAS